MASLGPNNAGIYTADWGTWTRRVAALLLIAGGLFALTLLGPVFSTTVIALLLAFALFYPVRALTLVFRLPYAAAVLVVFLLYLFLVFFVVLGLSGTVINFAADLLQQVGVRLNELLTFLQTWQLGDTFMYTAIGDPINIDFVLQPLAGLFSGITAADLQTAINNIIPAFNLNALGNIGGGIGDVFGTVTTTVGAVSGLMGSLVLIHFLALLFLLEIPRAFRWGIAITGEDYRREVAIVVAQSGKVWTGFFRGQLIVCLILGVGTWLQFLLMGIPGAVTMGIVVGVVSLVPLLGGFVALVPIALVPLFQGSTTLTQLNPETLMLITVAINLVFQQVIWNGVAPVVTGDAVSLPVPVIILGLFIGAGVAGILGTLLAAPTLGILRVLVDYVLRKIRGGDPYPGEPVPQFMKRGLFRELADQAIKEEEVASAQQALKRALASTTTMAIPPNLINEPDPKL